jgi:hypothetical protein
MNSVPCDLQNGIYKRFITNCLRMTRNRAVTTSWLPLYEVVPDIYGFSNSIH